MSFSAVSIMRAAATQAVPAAPNGVLPSTLSISATSTPWPRAITPRIPVCGVSTLDRGTPLKNSSKAAGLARSSGPSCGITAPFSVLGSSRYARMNICMCGSSLRRTSRSVFSIWPSRIWPWPAPPTCCRTRVAKACRFSRLSGWHMAFAKRWPIAGHGMIAKSFPPAQSMGSSASAIGGTATSAKSRAAAARYRRAPSRRREFTNGSSR